MQQDVEIEYQLEYEQTKIQTYEERLAGELLEMGIDWEQDDLNTMAENMMVVGSQEYPPHHSEGSQSLQSPPTIAEKGVEVGNVSDVSLTGDGEQEDDAQGPPPPPQTPMLSIKISGLSMEENECLFSLSCTGVHTRQIGPKLSDECTSIERKNTDMRNVLPVDKYIHTLMEKNPVKTPSTPGLSSELASMHMEENECICSRHQEVRFVASLCVQ